MARITIAEAKAELAQVGVTLTKRDGEFRVNVRGPSCKFYTPLHNQQVTANILPEVIW